MFETLGHYKILERIGAGGMGEIYRARDTRLGRTVAIKVVGVDVTGDPERRDRFVQEARATASLSHPNIATLDEIGEDQDQLFLVFEYVAGDTLKKLIADKQKGRKVTAVEESEDTNVVDLMAALRASLAAQDKADNKPARKPKPAAKKPARPRARQTG